MDIFKMPFNLLYGALNLFNYNNGCTDFASLPRSKKSSTDKNLMNEGRDLTETIPNEVFVKVFSYIDPTQICNIALVSKKWALLGSDLVKKEFYERIAIGPEKYAKFLDPETLKREMKKAYDSLTSDIIVDRKLKSGAFPGETVGETEILFWSVGSCTVNNCDEVFRKYLPEIAFVTFADKYHYDIPSDKSRWVSLTTKILPNSRVQPYKTERGILYNTQGLVERIAQLAKETGLNYEVPTRNLTVQGILAHLMSKQQNLIDIKDFDYLLEEMCTYLQEHFYVDGPDQIECVEFDGNRHIYVSNPGISYGHDGVRRVGILAQRELEAAIT